MNRRTSTQVGRTDDTPESANLLDMPEPAIDPDIPDLVSMTEAGRILRVNKQRTHVLVQEGRLPGKQITGSNAWVFRREVVEELKPKIGKRATAE